MTDIERACRAITQADGVLVGASNGLSIAEGYHIFADNEMFRSQFGDYREKYGIRCVIEGCFYNYPDPDARNAYMRRLTKLWTDDYRPSTVMKDLLDIIGKKDYFILTSNADKHLELSGFADERVFEVEGTFEDSALGRPMTDKSDALNAFLSRHSGGRLVILELGIGSRNRLIKQPIMRLAAAEPQATYITLNLAHELYIPAEIAPKSIGLAGDIADTLARMRSAMQQA